MTITLCTYTGEPNKLVKTFTNRKKYEVTLKDECTLRAPVFLLAEDLDNVSGLNYLLAFDKRYFIERVTSVRNGLIRIEARIDVLATYYDAIKNGTGYVVRSGAGSKYMDDPYRATSVRRDIVTLPFSGTFSDQCVILATAAKKT